VNPSTVIAGLDQVKPGDDEFNKNCLKAQSLTQKALAVHHRL
jgi:hypothetical protein